MFLEAKIVTVLLLVRWRREREEESWTAVFFFKFG
jgi:hypothetical protein